MKLKLFPILILTAVFIEIFILIIPKNDVTPFTPLMFWIIGALLMSRFILTWKKLTKTLKTSNPEIFDKYAFEVFGKKRIPRDTFKNQEVLDSLTPKGKELIKIKDSFYIYFFVCFILFALSGFLMTLK